MGWKEVISGRKPHSKLGHYAYLIGKAINESNGEIDKLLKSAIDSLSIIQTLHISFKHHDKWFCSIVFFQYVKKNIEKTLDRDLSIKELRYLSGAVFNTLDKGGFQDLLNDIKLQRVPSKLFFELESGEKYFFKIDEFESIVKNKLVDVNLTANKKASLFWTGSGDDPRGIYSRSISSGGEKLFDKFSALEIDLYKNDKGSSLSVIFESISNNIFVKDIFDHANDSFFLSDELIDEWDYLVSKLQSATRVCIEKSDFTTSLDSWKFSQRNIFSTGIKSFSNAIEVKSDDIIDSNSDILPSKEKIIELINSNTNIITNPPIINKSKPRSNSPKRITKTNYIEKAKRDSKIGFSGEEFIYEFERNRLNSLGKHKLADKVLWASKEIGDGLGYDILSYDEEDESYIFIEVKTTKNNIKIPFYLSSNELNVSIEKGLRYKIYRLFDFPKNPYIYIIPGPLNENLELTPLTYLAIPSDKFHVSSSQR